MAITGGFGVTMDLKRGTTRRWVMGRDGVKRWADDGEPVHGTSDGLVGPAFESAEWSHLGSLLDSIAGDTDEAVHKGFCKERWGLLDARLNRIEKAAQKARNVLRPNTGLQLQEKNSG
jgi:hypothetical protein